MKKLTKPLAVLLFTVIAIFSFTITASATDESNPQDGLVASITSSKDSYTSDEDIELTFKVTNTNDYAVENVSLEAIIPDGLTLKNKADTKINTVSLPAEDSLELSLVVVKGGTTSNTTTNTVNTKSSNNTVATGNNIVSYIIVGLVCLLCLVVAIVSFKFRKKTAKYLSIVLCVCISVGAVAVMGILSTSAEETAQNMSFDILQIISVDNKKYEIKVTTTYNKRNENTQKVLTNEQYNDFINLQKTTVEIERGYLNDDGYIDYEDTQSLLNDISDYLKTQKDMGIVDYFEVNTNSIFVKMTSGVNYIFTPEYKDYLSSGATKLVKRIVTLEPVKNSYEVKHEKLFSDFTINIGSLLLGTENLNTKLTENAELLGKEDEYIYFSEDSYANEEVTTNMLLNLPSNSFILFEGHGNYSSTTGSILFTSEKINGSIYNYGDESIVIAKDGTIGVTYQFFDKLEKNSLTGSTIYLGACCSTKDSRLANSLLDKGAENVLGYSDIVSMRYEIGLRTFLTYGLTLKNSDGSSYNLEDAYKFALSRYGQKDSSEPYACLEIIQNKTSEKESNENSDRYSAYLNIVNELKDSYGDGYIADDYRTYGLSVVRLLDFDGDGNEELYCVYWDSSDETAQNAKQVVYSYNNGTVTKVFEDSLSVETANGLPFHFVTYTEKNGKIYLEVYYCYGSGNRDLKDTFYAFDNGNFNSILSSHYDEGAYTGIEVYEINGNSVTKSEYDIALSDINSDGYKYYLDLSTQTQNSEKSYFIDNFSDESYSAQEVLNETQNVINQLNS